MGNTFGRQIVETVGRSIQVSADGVPEFKSAGVTVDWASVVAIAGSDVTYLDGVVVKVGEKALRYGQVLTKITATGLYAVYDPGAADGSQTLTRGEAFIVNETIREDELNSNHPPVFDGGRVFLDRILHSGVAAATKALGPTLANLLATFPRLILVKD
jgi:hypothetical protein